jgi:glucose/arabinose dehydrogenase
MLRLVVYVFAGFLVFVTAVFLSSGRGADSTVGKRGTSTFRLDRRVPLTTSRVVGFPDPPPPYRTRRVFEKLTIRFPVYLASNAAHDGLFVVEQNGRILYFNPSVPEKPAEFCKLADADTYSMIFHPDYRRNRLVYIFSNGPNSATRKRNQILRFRTIGETPRCDPASRQLVIEWESNGHNGGDMAFGNDGMLYISSGDGTTDSDGDVTGQDLRDLNSGIIRIDVDCAPAGKAYAVPKDNPFLSVKDARPELWAFGLRNPWRMSYDREKGDLYIADVGQDLWEMIYLGKRGANYGWSVTEGSHPFQPMRKLGPAPIVQPLHEHPHSESRSITGGFVYRGQKHADLRGAYVYGDYATGKIWALKQHAGKIEWKKEVAWTRLQIVGFGADKKGELYIVDHGGQIHQLEPTPPVKGPSTFPHKLSESGLFASVAGYRPLPSLIPYDVNSPLWSDGAAKERHIAMPGTERIGFTEQGPWQLPELTVLVKTFSLTGPDGTAKRIETRFLTLQQGEWHGYSFAWNDEQTDAELVDAGGKSRTFLVRDDKSPGGRREQVWRYPSRVECMVCHTRAGAYVLGVNTGQMNRSFDYGGATMNQLIALENLGLLRIARMEHWNALAERGSALRGLVSASLGAGPLAPLQKCCLKPIGKKIGQAVDARAQQGRQAVERKGGDTTRLPRHPDEYPRLADPYDSRADLEPRMRSYLHSNCAHCHQWAGGGNSAIDLQVNTPLDKTKLIRETPLHDRFGVRDALLVAPGSPERSILYQRISRRGSGQMPPLASAMVDEKAQRLLAEWIRRMK